jgi:hypothetical protein
MNKKVQILTGPVGQPFASCFGAAIRVPGMHPYLQWNRVLLLAISRYIGDPDMIPHHWLR